MTGPRLLMWAAPVAILALSSACDDTFVPFQEQERVFSVYGFFDAAADTQWVRVMPLRQTIFTSPEKLDVLVTLEDLETGETSVLNDSIFRWYSDEIDLGTDVYVHNFWTVADIEPGTTYRFTVARPDGVTSTATVPIPDQVSSVVVATNARTQTQGYVRFEGVQYLAMVQVLFYMPSGCPGPPFYAAFQSFPNAPDDPTSARQVSVSRGVTPTTFPCLPAFEDVRLVASGEQWPAGPEFASLRLAISDVPSNIDMALGFLGGVATTQVPWESCTYPAVGGRGGQQPPNEYCEVTYDAESASVEGVVMDASCGEPISRMSAPAAVTFTEVVPEGVRPLIRPYSTEALDGSYRIRGLEPGIDYAVEVSHPALWTPERPLLSVYETFQDTVSFSPGESRIVDIDMFRQITVCDVI